MVESGLQVDSTALLPLLPRATAAAATGVALPVLFTLAIVLTFGGTVTAGLAAGAAIAPTSLGFTSQLLADAHLLDTQLGRLIAAAAVLDDVMSLVLLAEVQALEAAHVGAWAVAAPIVASVGAILLGTAIAWGVSANVAWLEATASACVRAAVGGTSPQAEQGLELTAVQAGEPSSLQVTCSDEGSDGAHTPVEVVVAVPLTGVGDEGSVQSEGGRQLHEGSTDAALREAIDLDEVATPVAQLCSVGSSERQGDEHGAYTALHSGTGACLLFLMCCLATGMAAACSAVRSSDLLGVFLAGLAFSRSDATKQAWESHVHPFVGWGSALFFSCTVGFAVPPVRSLFTPGALGQGAALFLAAVAGKLALGVWAPPPLAWGPAMLLGWAMNGRGEFSFLIARQAVQAGLLSPATAGGVVWAVVLSTLLAPIGFHYTLPWLGPPHPERIQGVYSPSSSTSPSPWESAAESDAGTAAAS